VVVVARHRIVMMTGCAITVVARSINHARAGEALAVMTRRVAIAHVAVMHAVVRTRLMPAASVPMPAIAVDGGAGHARAVIIVGGRIRVTLAVVSVIIRTAVGVPSGDGAFLIGRH